MTIKKLILKVNKLNKLNKELFHNEPKQIYLTNTKTGRECSLSQLYEGANVLKKDFINDASVNIKGDSITCQWSEDYIEDADHYIIEIK